MLTVRLQALITGLFASGNTLGLSKLGCGACVYGFSKLPKMGMHPIFCWALAIQDQFTSYHSRGKETIILVYRMINLFIAI